MVNNVTSGRVSKIYVRIPEMWNDVFISDAVSFPGNSGGPVLDENFNIVGILVGGFSGYDNFSICEPVSDIKKALKEYEDFIW
jgi:S1-C subfamily serine protease